MFIKPNSFNNTVSWRIFIERNGIIFTSSPGYWEGLSDIIYSPSQNEWIDHWHKIVLCIIIISKRISHKSMDMLTPCQSNDLSMCVHFNGSLVGLGVHFLLVCKLPFWSVAKCHFITYLKEKKKDAEWTKGLPADYLSASTPPSRPYHKAYTQQALLESSNQGQHQIFNSFLDLAMSCWVYCRVASWTKDNETRSDWVENKEKNTFNIFTSPFLFKTMLSISWTFAKSRFFSKPGK